MADLDPTLVDAYNADVEVVEGIVREYFAPVIGNDDDGVEQCSSRIVDDLFTRWTGAPDYDPSYFKQDPRPA